MTIQTRPLSCLTLALVLAWAAPSMAQDYKSTPLSLANGVPGVLYEPLNPGPKAAIAVLAMHVNADYLRGGPANPCIELVKRGYRTLCANTYTSKVGANDFDEDRLLLNVKAGVAYLRKTPTVRKIVIFGHSGGGAMMSAYQNIAENGLKACQGPEKLIKCSDALADMPPADGVMLIDSSLGMAGSSLLAIDPAVVDESRGGPLAADLDMYNPRNGYDPKGSVYSKAFVERFEAAQGARENRLIARAEDRLAKIQAGQGLFKDDEVMVVPGATPAANKLLSADVQLMARTQGAWPLLHADGSVTTEVIHTVRPPEKDQYPTDSLSAAAIITTVRRFLSTYAVRTLPGYGYDDGSIHGIDYRSSYAIEFDSIAGITKPLLQMGMTGSHEFFFAETARALAPSKDKTLAYVEGARHGFTPCTECAVAKGLPENAYGDTVKTLYDYIDAWLSKPGRF